ncbi:dihydrodipicolinate reductase [Oceaniglobus trochenteri]|uniref:dihydrodipicolinate reductase n=1 Tax=Oceaniglobus trochenteri TaxID=2763260 RepID=UPI001CFFB8E3|nr:dihydrodipicolinate reductase [Oceaniglobus trochenteri]
MLRFLRLSALTTFLVTLALPVTAQEFRAVTDRATFVQLVEGRALGRFAVTLRVGRDGTINGRAFGRKVTGSWEWQGQYFCRDLSYGDSALAANCQQVLARGDTIRFVADRGRGQSADLTLR